MVVEEEAVEVEVVAVARNRTKAVVEAEAVAVARNHRKALAAEVAVAVARNRIRHHHNFVLRDVYDRCCLAPLRPLHQWQILRPDYQKMPS